MSKKNELGINVNTNETLTEDEVRERELERLADELLVNAGPEDNFEGEEYEDEPSDDELEGIEGGEQFEDQPDDESEKEEEEMTQAEKMAEQAIRTSIEEVEEMEAAAEKGFRWEKDPETGEAIRVKNLEPGKAPGWKNKGHQRNIGFRMYALMDLGLTVKDLELAVKARIDSGEFKPAHKPDGYDALYKGLGTGTVGRKSGSKKGYITVCGKGEIKKEFVKGAMYKCTADQIQGFVAMHKVLGCGLGNPIGFQYDLGSEQSKANALKKATILSKALQG